MSVGAATAAVPPAASSSKTAPATIVGAAFPAAVVVLNRDVCASLSLVREMLQSMTAAEADNDNDDDDSNDGQR